MQIVNRRLGPDMLKKTQHLMTSQKCEAANRSLSTSLPKQVTFSRNFPGRAHATVKRLNRGLGQAIYEQNKFIGAPLPAGSDAVKQLFKLQMRGRAASLRCKSLSSRRKRFMTRQKKYKMYDAKSAKQAYSSGMVIKCMKKKVTIKPAELTEHGYTKEKSYFPC